ncbi:MAG: multiheme c-type cytochrome [Desulfococcus multivorans]|jgi:hypothetical protein|nr:multiheme c-type cytochrome [Desulfococcus multivorans]
MKGWGCIVAGMLALLAGIPQSAFAEDEKEINCVACHRRVTPGHVTDWEASAHAEMGVDCSVCHGSEHQSVKNSHLSVMPDEGVCGDCHQDQFDQFKAGKHNHGWKSLNAMPVTHLEPDELMEGGRGCGGCHNMGIKSDAEKAALIEKGYRYQKNSCDECHTRHTFSKSEAQDPRACQQCHMGYDHPQWEMWSSAKHGTRWFTKDQGRLPETATAPTCQHCHLPGGTHTNRTAWGFFGVRLPMPEDPQWAADRATILKALGVLHPETGTPTDRLEFIKELDMVRLTHEDWQAERDKMVNTCAGCHSKSYGETQLKMGDDMMRKADRLMAQAIEIVAGLYKDKILEKPAEYAFAYPDFMHFMRTGGKSLEFSHIEQVLFEMYMKHRMRTYQGFYHVNPDYAYWYGWAMMTKDLGEIQELAHLLRRTHAAAGEKH